MYSSDESLGSLPLKVAILKRNSKKPLTRTSSSRLAYNLRQDFKDPVTRRTCKCPPRDSVLIDTHFAALGLPRSVEGQLTPAEWFARTDEMDQRVNSRTGRDLVIIHPLKLSPTQHIALSRDLTESIAKIMNTPAHGALHCRPGIFSSPVFLENGERKHANPHTHVQAADRDVHGQKLRAWGSRKHSSQLLKNLRHAVAAVINRHLRMAGLASRYEESEALSPAKVSNSLYYVRKSWKTKLTKLAKEAEKIMTTLAPIPWLQHMHALLHAGASRLPTKDEIRRLALAKKAAALVRDHRDQVYIGTLFHLHRLAVEMKRSREVENPEIGMVPPQR